MTFQNRIRQAILFEFLLLIISTVLVSWLMKQDMNHTAILMLIISVMAMVWNVVFNGLFDRWCATPRLERGLGLRCVHGVLFEGGLLLCTLPLLMYWFELGWWQALMMDVGMTVFVLIYTVIFHWCTDRWFVS